MRMKMRYAALLVSSLLILAQAAGAAVVYRSGPVIISAKVVNIFWGPTFANPASPDYAYAQTLIAFRNQFGTTPEYNVITQYYQFMNGVGQYIQQSNLGSGTPDWFDTSTPPRNVTDSAIRSKIQAYLTTHAFDPSTIYEVFLPASSYSSDGASTSCGGPNLVYCGYHDYFTSSSGSAVKYTVQPYPSCSGCQLTGWTAAQNQENLVSSYIRSTVVNPLFTGWYDSTTGADIGAKCLWSPAPFLDGGYGYSYEWSNAAKACVKAR